MFPAQHGGYNGKIKRGPWLDGACAVTGEGEGWRLDSLLLRALSVAVPSQSQNSCAAVAAGVAVAATAVESRRGVP